MSNPSKTFHPPTVHHMAEHILKCLKEHRSRFSAGTPCPPLFIGVQGPQGGGKTFTTSCLREQLGSLKDPVSVALLSIDDIYLPHEGLLAVAAAHPENPLLQGRGQPGTHDVDLGCALRYLTRLCSMEKAIDFPRARSYVPLLTCSSWKGGASGSILPVRLL